VRDACHLSALVLVTIQRPTHYEPVACVARGLEVRVYVGVCKVQPLAINGS